MGVRQEKFAGLIQQHLADIFVKNKAYVNHVFVTISRVEVSPDLGFAKVYLSLFTKTDKEGILESIRLFGKEIRHELAKKIKNQVRVIPELQFFVDESLDYVFHMEKVFQKIHEQDDKKSKDIQP